MTKLGDTSKKPGASTLNTGIVVMVVAGVLAVLNTMNEGRPPGWTLMLLAVGLVITVVGYAVRLLKAVDSR